MSLTKANLRIISKLCIKIKISYHTWVLHGELLGFDQESEYGLMYQWKEKDHHEDKKSI